MMQKCDSRNVFIPERHQTRGKVRNILPLSSVEPLLGILHDQINTCINQFIIVEFSKFAKFHNNSLKNAGKYGPKLANVCKETLPSSFTSTQNAGCQQKTLKGSWCYVCQDRSRVFTCNIRTNVLHEMGIRA